MTAIERLPMTRNRPRYILRARAQGAATCPKCLALHVEAGRQHLVSAWAIHPRCKYCATKLVMPWMEGEE